MPLPSDPQATHAERLQREDFFENETFSRLDLQGVDLGGKEFYRCTFEHAQLQESRWERAKLEECVFRGCDLTRAHVASAGLRGVRFEESKLMGVDWSAVSATPEMTFERCALPYTSFVGLSLRQTSFLHCTAREANFFDIDLTDADFTGTDLTGSNFRGCTLTRTDFTGTIGALLDPALNRVKDARVPVESAVLLAMSFGMRVVGYGEDLAPARGKGKRGR